MKKIISRPGYLSSGIASLWKDDLAFSRSKFLLRATMAWFQTVRRQLIVRTICLKIVRSNIRYRAAEFLRRWIIKANQLNRLKFMKSRLVLIRENKLLWRSFHNLRVIVKTCSFDHRLRLQVHAFKIESMCLKSALYDSTRRKVDRCAEMVADVAGLLERLQAQHRLQRDDLAKMRESLAEFVPRAQHMRAIEECDAALLNADAKIDQMRTAAMDSAAEKNTLAAELSRSREALAAAQARAGALEAEVARLSAAKLVPHWGASCDGDSDLASIPAGAEGFRESFAGAGIGASGAILDRECKGTPSGPIDGPASPVSAGAATRNSGLERLRGEADWMRAAMEALQLREHEGRMEAARLGVEVRRLQAALERAVPRPAHEGVVHSLCLQLSRLQAHADRVVICQAEQDAEAALAAAEANRLRAERDCLLADLEQARSDTVPQRGPSPLRHAGGHGSGGPETGCAAHGPGEAFGAGGADATTMAWAGPGTPPGRSTPEVAVCKDSDIPPCRSSVLEDLKCLRCVIDDLNQRCQVAPAVSGRVVRGDGGGGGGAPGAGSGERDAGVSPGPRARCRLEYERQDVTAEARLAAEAEQRAETGRVGGGEMVRREELEALRRSLSAEVSQARAQVDRMAVREAGSSARSGALSRRAELALAGKAAADAELLRARGRLVDLAVAARRSAAEVLVAVAELGSELAEGG